MAAKNPKYDRPAFPITDTNDVEEWGLSIREYYAGVALAALIQNPATTGGGVTITERAVELADALIDRLAELPAGTYRTGR